MRCIGGTKKEAYLLVYLHKIQPVRDEKFWSIDPSQAMNPPEICKLVGRPRVKRVREKDETRKKEGLWSKSRKGLQMTYENYSAAGHNRRKCPLLQRGRQVNHDVPVSAPQPSEEIESIFTPTLEFVASSSQHTSQVINEAPGPSKRSKISAKEIVVAHSSAIIDENEVEGDIESEDEESVVAPRVISEAKTRLQMKKLHQQPIGSRELVLGVMRMVSVYLLIYHTLQES